MIDFWEKSPWLDFDLNYSKQTAFVSHTKVLRQGGRRLLVVIWVGRLLLIKICAIGGIALHVR